MIRAEYILRAERYTGERLDVEELAARHDALIEVAVWAWGAHH